MWFDDHKAIDAFIDQTTGNGRTMQTTGAVKSFENYYQEFLSKQEKAEDSNQLEQLLDEYKDIVTRHDSMVFPIIQIEMFRLICNKDRIYGSQEYLFKVMDNKNIVIAKKEEYKELAELKTIPNPDNKKFEVFVYSGKNNFIEGRIQADCAKNSIIETYISDNRSVTVYARVFNSPTGNQIQPVLSAGIYGRTQSWFTGGWSRYSTELSYRRCRFYVSHANASNSSGILPYNDTLTNLIAPDYSGTSDEREHQIYYNHPLCDPFDRVGGQGPSIYFAYIHMEGSSRGVGDNWAIIDCGTVDPW